MYVTLYVVDVQDIEVSAAKENKYKSIIYTYEEKERSERQ